MANTQGKHPARWTQDELDRGVHLLRLDQRIAAHRAQLDVHGIVGHHFPTYLMDPHGPAEAV